MKKQQKKNLMILGGVIAGVVIIALGAFALNPQGGLYKGLIATSDSKLVIDDSKSLVVTKIEPETAPTPLPDPPPPPPDPEDGEEDLVISPAPPGSGEEEPEPDSSQMPSDPGDDSEDLVISPAPGSGEGDDPEPEPTLAPSESEFELKFTDSLEPIEKYEFEKTKVLVPQLLTSLVPIISGYNPTGTTYLPASYGSGAEVLYFDVNVAGGDYKQSDDIYLHDFFVEYNHCLGTSYKPETVPTLWSRDGYVIATDYDKDGKFARSEFNNPGTDGLPISVLNGLEFSIKMEVNSTMCPAGSFGAVIVRDILWEDVNGIFHLNDPVIENDIVSSFNDEYSILY